MMGKIERVDDDRSTIINNTTTISLHPIPLMSVTPLLEERGRGEVREDWGD